MKSLEHDAPPSQHTNNTYLVIDPGEKCLHYLRMSLFEILQLSSTLISNFLNIYI